MFTVSRAIIQNTNPKLKFLNYNINYFIHNKYFFSSMESDLPTASKHQTEQRKGNNN
jgi:hypothetical protein